MKKDAFLKSLADVLIAEPSALTPDCLLKDFRGWDSMGQMAVLTLLDSEVGVAVPPNWIGSCETVGQILDLAAPKLSS